MAAILSYSTFHFKSPPTSLSSHSIWNFCNLFSETYILLFAASVFEFPPSSFLFIQILDILSLSLLSPVHQRINIILFLPIFFFTYSLSTLCLRDNILSIRGRFICFVLLISEFISCQVLKCSWISFSRNYTTVDFSFYYFKIYSRVLFTKFFLQSILDAHIYFQNI